MTYEIIDRESGNSVASFDSEDEARQHLVRMVAENPTEREALTLVAFDAQGRAVRSLPAHDLPKA